MVDTKLRVMVAKTGLDGHDRGARVLARWLRDAGYEVIYTGCHQTPEQIVSAALQEDVDLLGLICLSGAHRYLYPEVIKQLRKNGAGDMIIIGGGIIPDQDFKKMYDAGLKAIFTPGASLESITDWINKNVKPRNWIRTSGADPFYEIEKGDVRVASGA